MFSTSNIYITILAVTMAMICIISAIYYVNKIFSDNTQEILVRFILLVFTALVGVFVVDKVIAFGLPLLSDHQNDQLFDLIKTLTLMIFSYYFGTKKEKDETE
jgi:purine-cytosine permease-like protein